MHEKIRLAMGTECARLPIVTGRSRDQSSRSKLKEQPSRLCGIGLFITLLTMPWPSDNLLNHQETDFVTPNKGQNKTKTAPRG